MNNSEAKNTILNFETTLGSFKIKMYDELVPDTVAHIRNLVSTGFYEGIIFHRVIKDFMNQTGDPTGTGMGGSGTKIKDEFPQGLAFDKPGIVGMANAGPNTGDSQFFITVVPTEWLNNRHTIFGEVSEGMDIIININRTETDHRDRPIEPVVIKKVTIL